MLKALLVLAPIGAGLLTLLDDDGNTPLDLAGKINGIEGMNLREVLEGFQQKDAMDPSAMGYIYWMTVGKRVFLVSIIATLLVVWLLRL